MSRPMIRHLIIALLMFTGIFHLAVALLGAAPGLGWGLTAFGFLFIGVSFFVRRDVRKMTKKERKKDEDRFGILLAMGAAAAGLVIGGGAYLSTGGPLALPFMFVIDIAIIAAGGAWLAKGRAA